MFSWLSSQPRQARTRILLWIIMALFAAQILDFALG